MNIVIVQNTYPTAPGNCENYAATTDLRTIFKGLIFEFLQ